MSEEKDKDFKGFVQKTIDDFCVWLNSSSIISGNTYTLLRKNVLDICHVKRL